MNPYVKQGLRGWKLILKGHDARYAVSRTCWLFSPGAAGV